MIMSLYAARNLRRQIACFHPPPMPLPPPSPHGLLYRTILIQPRICIVIGKCVQLVKDGWARTGSIEAARRNSLGCDAVKAVSLAKRRSLILRDPSLLRSSPTTSR